MTTHQVEERTGRPVSGITEEREMLDITNGDYQYFDEIFTFTTISQGEENVDIFRGNLKNELIDLDVVHSSISNGEDIRTYEYPVKRGDDIYSDYVYFYRGQVLYFTGKYTFGNE